MKRPGISLIEVVVAMVILATVTMSFVAFQGAMVRSNQLEKDRAFAMQKAVQMMEELKARVAGDAATILDDFNQGETAFKFELTTESVGSALDPLSDNVPMPVNTFRYVRQIEVKPLPRDKGARQVTVRVYLSSRQTSPNRAYSKGAPQPALATLTNIFKTPPVIVEPSQMYDVWVIRPDGLMPGKWSGSAYSNPGWYVGFENTAISYLKAANPGLEINRKELTLTTYGRDPWYSPLYNSSGYYDFVDGTGYGHRDASRVQLNMVYFLLGGGDASRSWETFASGPFRKTVTNPGASSEGYGTYAPNSYNSNPLAFVASSSRPYQSGDPNSRPLADQFNHGLRYVEEKEKIAQGAPYTIRGLLDDMLEKKRRNAIISNMEGEVFPFIPMRNYSDAARVPDDSNTANLAGLWGVTGASSGDADDGAMARLVTHPLQLEYKLNDTVELRVFPYKFSKVDREPPSAYQSGMVVLRDVLGYLKDIYPGGDVAQDVQISVIYPYTEKHWFFGDVFERVYKSAVIWPPVDSAYDASVANTYLAGVDKKTTNSQGYFTNDLAIRFKSIPFTHLQMKNEWAVPTNYYGIKKDNTLYGMHYYPDPNAPLLTDDIPDSVKDDYIRNTARFFIRFKLNSAKRQEVLTTLGAETDLSKHRIPNLSRTWTWVGTPAPESERYQLVGDPRHNPYADVRDDGRYNRYFANLTSRAYGSSVVTSWNAFAGTAQGWGPNTDGSGKNDVDVPAYLGLWRKALLNSSSMLCQPSGLGFRILALGSEYGGGTWQADVLHSTKPFDGKKNKTDTYDEWKNPTIPADKDNKKDSWSAMPWLGEIWPDASWADWRDTGNLPSSDFRRFEAQDLKSYPDDARWDRSRYVDKWGPLSLFNAKTDFTYENTNAKAEPTNSNGKNMDSDLNAKLNPGLDLAYGFTLSDTSNSSRPAAEPNRGDLETGLVNNEPQYYKSSTGRSAVMPFLLRDSADNTAYFMFFSPYMRYAGNNDPYSMQRVYYASIIQGYLDMAGRKYSGPANKPADARILLPPRIKLTAPEDDAMVTGNNVTITWTPEWKRWDAKDYSRQYNNYTANYNPDVVYNLKYSPDQGNTWYYITAPTTKTTINSAARYNAAQAVYSTSYTWNLSTFANRQYQIRIEGYRYNSSAPGTYELDHHAFTQFSINLAR